MIVARRDMVLNGQNVVAGQVLDSIWPDLHARTQTVLLRQRRVEYVEQGKAPEMPNNQGPRVLSRTVAIRADDGTVSWRAEPVTSVETDPPVTPTVEATPEAPRKRGRPKGSKNKPKPAAQAVA